MELKVEDMEQGEILESCLTSQIQVHQFQDYNHSSYMCQLASMSCYKICKRRLPILILPTWRETLICTRK